MSYDFHQLDLEQIAKLPQWIQDLKSEYPSSVINAADALDEPGFPVGYQPLYIEVYYVDGVDSDGIPDLSIDGQNLEFVKLETTPKSDVIEIYLDGYVAYIQIKHLVILDRLHGVILPEVLLNPARRLFSTIQLLNSEQIS